jgi:hypothetical protein
MTAKLSLSPSSSHRWLTCTASPTFILANDAILPKEESSYSIEGKKAHAAAAAGLLMGKEALVEACDGDGDMLKHITGYIQFVEDKHKHGDEVLIETEVPVWFYEGKRGFIDHARLNSKRLCITDLKYGEGVYVMARGNTQMAIYAMSLVQALMPIYGFQPDFLIILVIYQPRCRRSGDKPYSLWSLTLEELVQFVQHISDTADAIRAGREYTFMPSDANCGFCRGVSRCSARAKQLLGNNEDILPARPDPLQSIYLKDPATLPTDTLAFLLENKSAITSWLEKLQKYAYAAVKGGTPELVGNYWKLVQSKDGNRFYTDPKKAEKFLKEHIPAEELFSPASLISPAQAEKKLEALFGKRLAEDLLADITSRPPGGETLAPINDKRDAVNEDHAADFDNLDHHDLL